MVERYEQKCKENEALSKVNESLKLNIESNLQVIVTMSEAIQRRNKKIEELEKALNETK